MPNNEQKTRKGPMMLTQEQIQMLKAHREERLRKMETDLEFRKKMEKREADIEKIALFNDCIETNTK